MEAPTTLWKAKRASLGNRGPSAAGVRRLRFARRPSDELGVGDGHAPARGILMGLGLGLLLWVTPAWLLARLLGSA